MDKPSSDKLQIGFLAAAALVVLWRATTTFADWQRFGNGALGAGALTFEMALELLGFGFLACALLVRFKVSGTASAVLATYALCGALHWGGIVEVADDLLRVSLTLFYLVTSGLLLAGANLHVALIIPPRKNSPPRRSMMPILYGPAVLGALISMTIVALRAGGGASKPFEDGLGLMYAAVTNLYGLLSLVVVVTRFVRAAPKDRRAAGQGLLVTGVLAAEIPYIASMVVHAVGGGGEEAAGAGTDPMVLFFILTPISFTAALLRSARPPRG